MIYLGIGFLSLVVILVLVPLLNMSSKCSRQEEKYEALIEQSKGENTSCWGKST